MTGMAKPTNTKSRSDYAHKENARTATRNSATTPTTRTTRPVERGVGLSREGTRVTSVSYQRSATSPAHQRSSNESRPTIGRSGNDSPRVNSPSTSPSKTTSTPTQGRRKN